MTQQQFEALKSLIEANFEHFSASVSAGYADHEGRLRALED